MPGLALPLPDFATLAPFIVACLALNLTPGADMAYIVARSLGQGRMAGILSAFGVAAGCLAHTLAAAVGLSAILAHSATLFAVIKYAGAAYLLFLAWRALRGGAAAAMTPTAPAGGRRIFLAGALTNILNPKVALFILAFLPQFVDPAKGAVAAQILLLGLIFNLGGTAVNLAVAISTSAARRLVAGSPRFGRLMRYFTATVFVGLAIRLAATQRE